MLCIFNQFLTLMDDIIKTLLWCQKLTLEVQLSGLMATRQLVGGDDVINIGLLWLELRDFVKAFSDRAFHINVVR